MTLLSHAFQRHQGLVRRGDRLRGSHRGQHLVHTAAGVDGVAGSKHGASLGARPFMETDVDFTQLAFKATAPGSLQPLEASVYADFAHGDVDFIQLWQRSI